ncbi:DUF5671 domain-containing protein [Microbacterium sp. NIBRBAC000506063]|uniref:DUF5671 domain-containing protein n=1 Tax=Microbacterium sp. NIBRBAC000506063 TaxID=2734618 RepID=UPI001BB5E8D5|nr:DUF5671 domain-containing protein [Microbacterium sp. NIBRBAC000506063]QTV79406.1 hypothetical protein KAE78_10715 [Microbacterium sp. NIBRBAC000506063]
MSQQLPGTAVSGVVRRWIVYAILFTLVAIAANGVSSLLGRLLDVDPLFDEGTYGLALALAYALIGGPLALLLWWLVWRRLDDADRGSVAWGLYIAAMYVTSLVVFTVGALSTLAALVRGDWQPWECASAIVWFAVWLGHHAMLRHRDKGPTRLATLPVVLGAAYGLGVAAFSAGRTLQGLLDTALLSETGLPLGDPWWQSVLQSLIWCAGGILLWWWHWFRDGARRFRGGFADVALVLTGILAAAGAMLGGVISLLHTGLRGAFDPSASSRDLLGDLALAIAAAVIGAIVWLYHRRIVLERGERTRAAAGLVEAGLGLIALASGIGVVLNALLAATVTPLAGSDALSLLFGGLAALIVGAIVWVWAWRPLRVEEGAGGPARRVYLVAVFGASAVVALSTLLVIGFRIFELVLDSSGGVVERVRAPLGLLVATALVAGYHFAIWRRDRAAAPASAAPARAFDQVVLVAAGDAQPVAQAIREATGASVVVWTRSDAAEPASAETITAALEGVEARRVLVVAGAEGRVEVVPLAG